MCSRYFFVSCLSLQIGRPRKKGRLESPENNTQPYLLSYCHHFLRNFCREVSGLIGMENDWKRGGAGAGLYEVLVALRLVIHRDPSTHLCAASPDTQIARQRTENKTQMNHKGGMGRRHFLSSHRLINYKLLNDRKKATTRPAAWRRCWGSGFPCINYQCTESCTDNWDTCILLLGPGSWAGWQSHILLHIYLQAAKCISTNNWNQFCFKVKLSSSSITSLRFATSLTP